MTIHKIIKNRALPAALALSGLFLFGFIAPAFADGNSIQGTAGGGGGGAAASLGDMFSDGCENAGGFVVVFNYLAYTAGIFFAIMGIHYFRLHADNQANHPINRPIMLMTGAALLLVFPTVLKTVAGSLGYAVSANMAGCLAAGNSGGGSGGGLDVMMANFVSNIQAPLTALVQVIANIAGVFMMVHGLMKASKYGFDPKTHSIHSIVTNIVFGAILFTIGGNFSMVMTSVFGGAGVTDPTSTTVTNWKFVSQLGGSAQFANAVAAALQFVQVIGFIAFVRGWLVMKKVVEGGGNVTMAQGITHIVGGVLAINIGPFLKIMDTTFGTGLM